ncbi:Rne/Rng family ribonuclease [Bifidobacterium sp. 79T10]|nr:Rne/Rng family ribonuclease [Bifidobacterium saguinibicoloris]
MVPAVNTNGVDDVDALNLNVSDSSDAAGAAPSGDRSDAPAPAPAPTTRRRRGRRVVRGTGAAGASLELKVEDHSRSIFEEPKLDPRDDVPSADAGASRSRDDDADERVSDAVDSLAGFGDRDDDRDDDVRPARSRRRRSRADVDDEDDAPRTRRRSRSRYVDDDDYDYDDRPSRSRRRRFRDDDDDDDVRPSRSRRRSARDLDDEDDFERAEELIDELPVHDRRDDDRTMRPMTSLLFQEPVIPVSRVRDDDTDDEDEDDEEDVRPARSRRDRDEQEEGGRRRRRRSRSRQNDDETDARDDAPAQDAGADRTSSAEGADEGETKSRRGRNRRLNAQERRAAAEVEQIEEDLELDDIAYSPIAEEENGQDEEEPRTRRRRRRRAKGDQTAAQEEKSSERDSAADDAEHADRPARDEEETVTRRRRRRRGKTQDDDEQVLVRRSRKQQYIDEITDVEGSTRLEAKKQRRRDNRRERSRQSQIMEQDFLARRENVERLMVVREKEHHTQISVVEDNVLVEHYVSDIQEVQTVGNVYLGRVQNVLPSMEAAFVDIGQARNGVLYAGEVNWDATRLDGQPRRIELAFKSGDPVLVQVTKDPIGHKGARLTSQVTLAGRFLVLVPSGGMTGVSRKLPERERTRLKNIVSKIAPKDMGVIIRTAAEGASEEAIVKDLESLVRQWERINAKREEFWHGKRPKLLQGEPDVAIRVVRDIFNDDFTKLIVEGDKVYDRIEEYLDTMAPDLKDKLEKWDPAEHEGKDVFDKWQIDSQLRKGMERQVYLPSGGSIVIDRTEAMTTIDVNTGRFIGKGKSLEETVTRCNLEASEEIARQLRLRDIGGMIMIDYVDMVMPANRDLVLRRLVECLARDRTKHQVAEVTSLGLVQMTRKRIGQGLVEAFSEECPTCKGRGFILHDKPIVSADYDDPYALRGGDPFVKTNKHGRGTAPAPEPAGSTPDVKAKLAQIAAAAVAANNADE